MNSFDTLKSSYPTLNEVFSDSILEELLQSVGSKSTKKVNREHIRYLLMVMSDKDQDEDFSEHHKMQLDLWESYLASAKSCGANSPKKWKELVKHLTSGKEEAFRSSIAECIACCFFSNQLKMKTKFNDAQKEKGKKSPDLVVELPVNNILYIEVKAPSANLPDDNVIRGFDGNDKQLKSLLKNSNKQFKHDSFNILFIDSHFSNISLFYQPKQLEVAFFGDVEIQFLISEDGPIGEPETVFVPDGNLIKPIKPDGAPGYTRISAIIVFESVFMDKEARPKTLVIYNPYAEKPLYPDYDDIIKTDMKLIPQEDKMIWITNK